MKLFIIDTTAFYKKQLYSRLSKETDIRVLYTGYQCEARNGDFSDAEMDYPHQFLCGNKWQRIWQLYKILRKGDYSELILGGWSGGQDTLYAWFAAFVSPKRKNAVSIESTIKESTIKGPKAWVKKLFLSRMSRTYVCGTSHAALIQALGFKGEIVHTHGVGVFRRVAQPAYQPRVSVQRFLYVGRLIAVKNLQWLIERFNKHPELKLDIVGFGPLEEEVKQKANPNISFYGAVKNADLSQYYQQTDVFVLPSLSETWGVVVEEALNNGTPVMLSEQVGCAEDLVNENTGVVFKLTEEDFEMKLAEICQLERYNQMRKYISNMDFKAWEQAKINSYLH